VTVVKVTLEPGCTNFVSLAADGDGGGVTVGVIVAITR
jgi:hypothetical protein